MRARFLKQFPYLTVCECRHRNRISRGNGSCLSWSCLFPYLVLWVGQSIIAWPLRCDEAIPHSWPGKLHCPKQMNLPKKGESKKEMKIRKMEGTYSPRETQDSLLFICLDLDFLSSSPLLASGRLISDKRCLNGGPMASPSSIAAWWTEHWEVKRYETFVCEVEPSWAGKLILLMETLFPFEDQGLVTTLLRQPKCIRKHQRRHLSSVSPSPSSTSLRLGVRQVYWMTGHSDFGESTLKSGHYHANCFLPASSPISQAYLWLSTIDAFETHKICFTSLET